MENLIEFLGSHGEEFVVHLLGGERLSHSNKKGDIEHSELGARLEVKVRSNHDRPFIKEDQHEMKLRECESHFLFQHCWYCIIKYRNSEHIRKGDKRSNRRLFSEQVNAPEDIPEFLRQNISGVYILDSKIVEAIRRAEKTASIKVRHSFEKRSAFQFGWKLLNDLSRDANQTLFHLGVNPRGIKVETVMVKTEFQGLPITAPVLFATPKKLEARRQKLPVMKYAAATSAA